MLRAPIVRRYLRLILLCLIITSTYVAVSLPTPLVAAEPNIAPTGPFGGVVRSLALDRTNPAVLYAGTDRGLFKTTTSGTSWERLPFGTQRIVDVAIDAQATPPVVYAADTSGRIARSNDGGASWQTITGGAPGSGLTSLAVDPYAAERVWLGATGGVFRWDSDAQAWQTTAAISYTADFAFHDGVVYVSTSGQDAIPGSIFKSVNNGADWQPISGDLPIGVNKRRIWSVLADPSDVNKLYIGTGYDGAFRTTNGGATWVPMNTGLPGFTDVNDIQRHPTNPSILYAATRGYFPLAEDRQRGDYTATTGIYRSTNGGGSWEQVNNGMFNRYVYALAVHPTVEILFAGTDGSGVFRSNDGGDSWAQRTQGINALEVKGLARYQNTLYAGTDADGVFRSFDGGTIWERFNPGMPAVALPASSPAVDAQGTVYAGFSRFGLARLAADSWQIVDPANLFTDLRQLVAGPDYLVIMARNPSAGNEQRLFLATAQGASWQDLTAGFPVSLDSIRSLTVQSEDGASAIFAATSNGLFRADRATMSWSQITQGLNTSSIYQIAFDPDNSQNAYLATWDGFYLSTNGGLAWSLRTNGIGCCLTSVTRAPLSQAIYAYAANENRIYQSTDNGSFWTPYVSDAQLPTAVQSLYGASSATLLIGTSSGMLRVQTEETPPPPNTWTIMVYLSGDNDLDTFMRYAFNDLELAAGRRDVTIVALWDRLGADNTREYLVQPDRDPFELAAYTPGVSLWDYGELDMGSPATLAAFINRSRERFPADHYMLAIVDHGGGWSARREADLSRTRWFLAGSGLSWDWTTPGYSYLSTRDMGLVLTQAAEVGGKIDLVFYDACLMGMLEEAYEIRNGADYLVASQNLSFSSFPYDKYLLAINKDGIPTQPRDLARIIVDEYYNSLPGYPRTIAAMDLSQAASVRTALNSFADALLAADPAATGVISSTFQQTQKFDYNSDLAIGAGEAYIDLVDFARRLTAAAPQTSVSGAADNLVNEILNDADPLIIRERHASGRYAGRPSVSLEGANGLSIYLPIGERDSFRAEYSDINLQLAADSRWDEYIFQAVAEYNPQSTGRGDTPGANIRPVGNLIYLPMTIQ